MLRPINVFGWLAGLALFALCLRLLYQSGIESIQDSSGESAAALYSGRGSLYFFFQGALFAIFDTQSLRPIIAIQAAIDSTTVIAIGLAAMALTRELAVPAAVTAAIIPNFFVHASSDLPETLFVAFFSWSLCAMLWALRDRKPTVLLLIVSGLLLGFAILTRVVLAYFAFFLVPVLAYALHYKYRSWLHCAALALIPAFLMVLVALPLFIYNFLTFGYFELSSQSGRHLLYWVYGCLATPWPCSERARVAVEVTYFVKERMQALGIEYSSFFEVAAIEREIAIERILKLPLWQIVGGMLWGAFKNLMQTGFYGIFTQYNQPLTFISAMTGESIVERIRAFLCVNKGNYLMMMGAVSQIALVLSRGVQLYGIAWGFRAPQYRGASSLLLLTIVFFLAISGPVADPKYRMPMEPALIVFFAVGIVPLIARISNYRAYHKPTVN